MAQKPRNAISDARFRNWLFGKNGALFRAAAMGNVPLARELVAKGANVRVKSNNGFTALHRAAEKGHADMVSFLLKAGADPKSCTKENLTPAQLARQNKHSRVLTLLSEAGAKGSAQGNAV